MKRKSSETTILQPKLKEITNQSTIIASSNREGKGVEHLLDKNEETYWESAGDKPHTLTFLFNEYRSI